MVKSTDNNLVTKVEVVKVGPSAEELALRLIETLAVSYGVSLNGTNLPDGSVIIENSRGEVVARVLPGGTAIITMDGEEGRSCAEVLPQAMSGSGDKTQSGLSEDDIWEALGGYQQQGCDPYEQCCQWDEAQQTQNNSKPFSSSSESYASSTAHSQTSSSPASSSSSSTNSAVPQPERDDAPSEGAKEAASKRGGDASSSPAFSPAAMSGAAAPALEGDPNLAPSSIPPAPEMQLASAAQPAVSASAADTGPAVQAQSRDQQVSRADSYPDVSTLVGRVAGRLVRFVESIIGNEAAPRREADDHAVHASHSTHSRTSSENAVKVEPLPISDPMTGREGRAPEAGHAAAPVALVKPVVQMPSHADALRDFPMGQQLIAALMADVANDPLAIACATSAAGLFQLPPFSFALGGSLSAIAILMEHRLLDRVQPMITAQRGHGEERGQHDEQQQGRHQQQQDPYAAELA